MAERDEGVRKVAGAGALGEALRDRTGAKLGVIAVLFAVPMAFILAFWPFAGENPVAIQGWCGSRIS